MILQLLIGALKMVLETLKIILGILLYLKQLKKVAKIVSYYALTTNSTIPKPLTLQQCIIGHGSLKFSIEWATILHLQETASTSLLFSEQ
jgi:hypothetical protein